MHLKNGQHHLVSRHCSGRQVKSSSKTTMIDTAQTTVLCLSARQDTTPTTGLNPKLCKSIVRKKGARICSFPATEGVASPRSQKFSTTTNVAENTLFFTTDEATKVREALIVQNRIKEYKWR